MKWKLLVRVEGLGFRVLVSMGFGTGIGCF